MPKYICTACLVEKSACKSRSNVGSAISGAMLRGAAKRRVEVEEQYIHTTKYMYACMYVGLYIYLYILKQQVRVGEICCRAAHHIEEIKLLGSRYMPMNKCVQTYMHRYIHMHTYINISEKRKFATKLCEQKWRKAHVVVQSLLCYTVRHKTMQINFFYFSTQVICIHNIFLIVSKDKNNIRKTLANMPANTIVINTIVYHNKNATF